MCNLHGLYWHTHPTSFLLQLPHIHKNSLSNIGEAATSAQEVPTFRQCHQCRGAKDSRTPSLRAVEDTSAIPTFWLLLPRMLSMSYTIFGRSCSQGNGGSTDNCDPLHNDMILPLAYTLFVLREDEIKNRFGRDWQYPQAYASWLVRTEVRTSNTTTQYAQCS